MKKWIALLLGICMMFLCVGCGAEMRLEPAQLTDEDRINPLLVQDGIIPGQVYAYHTSDRLESIRSVLYKLGIDGKWEVLGSSEGVAEAPDGRIMFFLPSLPADQFRVIVENGDASYGFTLTENVDAAAGLPSAAQWQDPMDIAYEQEVPVVILSVTDGESSPHGIGFFGEPQGPKEDESVYAITVTFSEHPLGS